MFEFFHQCRGCEYDKRVYCEKKSQSKFIDYEVGKEKCDERRGDGDV